MSEEPTRKKRKFEDKPPGATEEERPIRKPTPLFPTCRSKKEYEILNHISSGTYGSVYRAQNKTTGEIVALKKVKLEVDEKQGFSITSLRETTLLMNLDHENILNVTEIVVGEHKSVYLVMEFLEHDLKVLMDDMKGPFLAPEIKCLLLQLLKGVHHLHSNWIIHRDLKTANLLLSNRGVLKVADFGLAREFGSPQKILSPSVVTLWYRAPELLLQVENYTKAVDMWAVGCIFAELITREPLFPGQGEIDQITKIFSALGTPTEETWPGWSSLPFVKKWNLQKYNVCKLREKVPMITGAAYDLLAKMLTCDPAQRITAEDALNHHYFKENPPPQHPSMMPTFPSRAEGGPVRKRTLEDFMTGQNLEEEGGLLNDSVYNAGSGFQLRF